MSGLSSSMALGKYDILAERNLLHRGRSAADLVSVGNCLTAHIPHLEPAGLVRSGVAGPNRSEVMLIRGLEWY